MITTQSWTFSHLQCRLASCSVVCVCVWGGVSLSFLQPLSPSLWWQHWKKRIEKLLLLELVLFCGDFMLFSPMDLPPTPITGEKSSKLTLTL